MNQALSQGIGNFYDASSLLWEEVWGEHMHHGYYGKGGNKGVNRRQAQIDLIDELLCWGGVSKPQKILDLGCGIGGSSLYLASKYNCAVVGVTLSPVQQHRATARAQAVNLDQRVEFKVANALNLPFAEGTFDLVWSLESAEHMPNKTAFLQECYRVLSPGGRLLMATWCHRSEKSWGGQLTKAEQDLLGQIYQVYYLPYVISIPEYEAIATAVGFQSILVDDWSLAVAKFWDEVAASIFEPRSLMGLTRVGLNTWQGALGVKFMIDGYRSGLIRFGVLTAVKPA